MYITSIYNDNILINIKDLYSSINTKITLNDYITKQINKKLSNKCNSDGLIIKNSIRIINRNTGSFNLTSDILYNITYKADILFPNEGSIIENCKIIYSSDILYIAYNKQSSLIIVIPKNFIDTNIDIKKNNYINIICLDKYFEINDKYMFIIGMPHYDTNTITNISNTSNNDNICRNILKNITQFKKEYYNIFYNTPKETIEQVEIDYNLYQYKDIELNSTLTELKNSIIQFIETNNIQNIDTNSISNINDEKVLLSIFNDLIDSNNQIYIDYKKKLYHSDYDEDLYKQYISETDYIKTHKTDNSGTINNEGNYCYIISVLQILKNCKLFLKDLSNYTTDDDDKNLIINELKLLLIDNKNDLQPFIRLLETYFTDYNIDWNIHNMNDSNDFIYILFNIIDNTITTDKFIKNVYDNIDTQIFSNFVKTNNDTNLNTIINTIRTNNQPSILKHFYNILVSEYTCNNCNFKYFHTENILTHNINIDYKDINNINKCINLNYTNNEHIDGFICPICKNKSIHKKCAFDIENINYFICSLNRWSFTLDTIIKNNNLLDIDTRLNINAIDTKLSDNSIVYKNIIMDLKSIICHIGTINNGHYIAINKNKNDNFYIYNDSTKNKISTIDFFNNDYFKKNVYTLVFQNNIIHDLPLSNLSLLEYEHNIMNDYSDTITTYVKNNIKVGVHIGGNVMLGGYKLGYVHDTLKNLNNIKYIIQNLNSDILSISELILSFKNLLKDDIVLLNEFNTYDFSPDNSTDEILDILGDFLLDHDSINKYDKYFYIEILNIIINNIRNDFDKLDEKNKFLEKHQLLESKNIYIGSSGYNTETTNHWDIIYARNENNLDLYSKHFNTIEINHTYYNIYDTTHWDDILQKITDANILKENLRLSIILHKDISDLLLDINNIHSETELPPQPEFDEIYNKILESKIRSLFYNIWNNNIDKLSDFIDNILIKFDSDFQYSSINFNNLKSFVTLKQILEPLNINIIFEFYDEEWYQNKEVIEFFIDNDLSMTSLIINNNDLYFGSKINTNSNNNDLLYLNNNFKVNYIKLYGFIHKYYGSHVKDIPHIFKYLKESQNIKLFDKLKSGKKQQYVYFNNIEGNINDVKYSANPENIDIPTSIYEGRLLYKLLQIHDLY